MTVSEQPYALDEHEVKNRLSKPLTINIAELWMLNDVVRHEMPGTDTWKFPPVSRELNEEIALAIHACVTDKLDEYTLLVTEGDLLVLDFCIRRDMKTLEGAKGEDVLKKVFAVRAELAFQGLLGTELDETFKQANTRSKKDATSGNSDDAS